MKLAVNQRFGFDQPVFAVVGKRLPFRQTAALFNQVAPGVVAVFLITPLVKPVVLQVVEAAGVEVQPVGGYVVAEFLAIDQSAGVAAVQLALSFVFVLYLAAQFTSCPS
ncbi:hypothetical protein PSFL111601_28250 [Pseudomonas floridensis]